MERNTRLGTQEAATRQGDDIVAWHEVDDKALPTGVISVNKGITRITIGVSTARVWRLSRFKTVTARINSTPGLIAFQFYDNNQGKRSIMRKRGQETIMISCQRELGLAGAEQGRFLAHKETSNLIIADFHRKLPEGWTPQHN